MDRIYGKTTGLRGSQQKRLQRLYRRKIPAGEIVSRELARHIATLSRELNRQLALLITRTGQVAYVVVGDRSRIWIPDLSGFRQGQGRLKGLRCVHTHLNGEPLSKEDLSDLILLRLDLMVCIQVTEEGLPGPISFANILPANNKGEGWVIHKATDIGRLNTDFLEMILSLESELARSRPGSSVENKERSLLVGVTTGEKWLEEERLDELEELAVSDDIEVAGRVVQRIKKPDPRFLIGKGKLTDLALKCVQNGSNLLIFNNELTPAQVKNLTDFTELKIIDRSQLILDIFARRAVTREGKIQVELAQLKYLLPRLATKNTAMSRLTGGIGGRGPGETKLEINRRRVHERIARLKRELKEVRAQRQRRRRLRNMRGLPVISIVGYTNAGKSTLLNALTHSNVRVRNRMFETLDPSSRRLRFPKEREAIITDTVGFIRDLPRDLMDAFAATLEELHDADFLIHVVDATHPGMEKQISEVNKVLAGLDLEATPTLVVLNKTDLLEPDVVARLEKRTGGIAISAINPPTLKRLIQEIESVMWSRFSSPQISVSCSPS
ncbi:MAG: GTPase HflX [Deltaproteobacteria bacterium]|nr:MAG: GTPase HflX [Deltaproteobacteria bacterium]